MWRVKSWRWFTVMIGGLLSDPDSPLARRFALEDPKPEVPDGR